MKENELRDNITKQVLAECIEFCEVRGIDSEKLRFFSVTCHSASTLKLKS